MKEAAFCKADKDGAVLCLLCPHNCLIPVGAHGRCRVRVNRGGTLYAESWGRISSLALDPIEKKPLSFFHPQSQILSVGSWGCNLSCRFCQNHRISQECVPLFLEEQKASDIYLTPQDLVATAREAVPRGNIGVAFTYNEPLVSIEYLLEAASLVQQAGLVNVVVTNGFIQPDCLDAVLPYITAMNIDLKAFNDHFYQTICGASRQPVMESIVRAVKKCHVEITTLIIPGCNDAPQEIEALARWLSQLSPDIPLHLTRHHPDYRMLDNKAASLDHLMDLSRIASTYLSRVVLGNVSGIS